MFTCIKHENKYRILTWVLFFMFTIICLYSVDHGHDLLRSVGFILFLLIGLFLNVENLLMLIVVLEPLSIIFKFNGGYTVMPFLFIILFIKLLEKNNSINSRLIILLFLIMSISLLNYVYRGYSISSYVSFFICLLCFVWLSQTSNIDMVRIFERVVWLYVCSTLVECIFSGLFTNAVKTITSFSSYNIRNIGFSSEWDYGRHIVVSIAFLFYWIRIKKKHIVLSLFVIIYLIYCLVSTGLYSGLVALGVLILTIPFSFDGTMKRKLAYMLIAFLGCVVLGVITYYAVYLPMFSLRGQISNNGRFELWSMYYHDFMSNPLITIFGIGAGAVPDYAASISRLTTHNVIIEKLFEFGIVGISLLLYLLKETFNSHVIKLSKNYRILPLIVFLGTCLTQGVSGGELVFLLMILCL